MQIFFEQIVCISTTLKLVFHQNSLNFFSHCIAHSVLRNVKRLEHTALF